MEISRDIMVVGLNPALQKILSFDKFGLGRVNRAGALSLIPGGKAANFAKAVSSAGMGAEIYQFAGGAAGDDYCRTLDKEGLAYFNVATRSVTRTCTTLLCGGGGSTEVIEPSGVVLESEAKKLLASIMASMPKFKALAICGTAPPGVKAKFYASAAKCARRHGLRVLVDSCHDIAATLDEGPEVVKVNRDELKLVSGKSSVKSGAKVLMNEYPVRVLGITDGPRNAHLLVRNEPSTDDKSFSHYILSVPRLEKVVNPIGAGDTVSAVLLCSLMKGIETIESFKIALGAGCASCMNEGNAVFSMAEAKKIAAGISLAQV